MGKVLVVGSVVVLVLLIVSVVYVWTVRTSVRTKGDLSADGEVRLRQLNDSAAGIFRGLGVSNTIEDSDVLSRRSSVAIQGWLARYTHFQDSYDKETSA